MYILVSGAASGLGRAFVDTYRNDPNNHIFAVDRISLLEHDNPWMDATNVEQHRVDVTNEADITSFAQIVKDQPIDLFIHSAGIRGLVPAVEDARPDNVAAAETLEVMDVETMMRTYQINALGTFLLIRAMLPNLMQSKYRKVVVMTSRMGSLGYNTTGSAYAYRASKAALNAIVKSFSIDVPEVTFIMNHPGRVESKLVKYKEEGAISAEESVKGLIPLIERWGKSDSGKFFDRFGSPIEW
ncbi:hypothetical protein M8818_007226 [Zalaria obscura]|uniref:Uncharacterized protein n=1 Tax=Zalaria obscura TaxID=2024903 RepID=A0ACC3S5E5_9PEZI